MLQYTFSAVWLVFGVALLLVGGRGDRAVPYDHDAADDQAD
jgi:uncharacterized membrane protein